MTASLALYSLPTFLFESFPVILEITRNQQKVSERRRLGFGWKVTSGISLGDMNIQLWSPSISLKYARVVESMVSGDIDTTDGVGYSLRICG